jgi:two-component sensor histidine kinase
VAAVRAFVRDELRAVGEPAWPAELLASELASSVVRHARSSFEVTLSVSPNLRVECRDDSTRPPFLADQRDDVGFGLFLIQSLASAWGIDTASSTKTVWFEVSPRGDETTA